MNIFKTLDIFSRNIPQEPKSGEALMIVDMQPYFLPERSYYNFDEFLHARKKLISNILLRIEYHRDIGSRVVLVEMDSWKEYGRTVNPGETFDEIKAKAGNDCIVLKKDSNSPINCFDNSKKQNDALAPVLRLIKDSVIELSGVNATSCVMDTGISLKKVGIDFRVNGACILNYFNKGYDLLDDNDISLIRKDYATGRFFKSKKSDKFSIFPSPTKIDRNLDTGNNTDAKYVWEL